MRSSDRDKLLIIFTQLSATLMTSKEISSHQMLNLVYRGASAAFCRHTWHFINVLIITAIIITNHINSENNVLCLHSTATECRSLAGELSLSCA